MSAAVGGVAIDRRVVSDGKVPVKVRLLDLDGLKLLSEQVGISRWPSYRNRRVQRTRVRVLLVSFFRIFVPRD